MSDLLNYKCPACDGALEFDTASQKMKCPFCGMEYEMSELASKDEVLNTQAPDVAPQGDAFNWSNSGDEFTTDENGMAVYTCKFCGGEIVGDENTASTSCPFCNNPVVMSGKLSGMLKPNYVIPFKLDKKAAKNKLKEYISTKKFTPSSFKSENKLDEIKGIYVPYWLFDSQINANVQFEGTKRRTWKDNRFEYTETSYFDIFRSGNMRFENIPVDGSSKMEDELMESIEPFDFKDAVDFQTAYLAGYLADKYDVDMNAAAPRANERIKTSAEDTLRKTVSGYDSVNTKFSNIQLINGMAKYALYPVWLLNTSYKGEKYTFAMNGQTGKFIGNLPIDKGKIAGMFTGITAGVTAALFIIGKLLNLF